MPKDQREQQDRVRQLHVVVYATSGSKQPRIEVDYGVPYRTESRENEQQRKKYGEDRDSPLINDETASQGDGDEYIAVQAQLLVDGVQELQPAFNDACS
jgi:hypothetical protein